MPLRPAGLSDDEDEINEFHEINPPSYTKSVFSNICDCIWTQDEPALVNCIANYKAKGLVLDFDLIHNKIPLMVACEVPWPEGVKLLLQNGANPNAQKELMTPLAVCCTGRALNDEELAKCVDILLEHGSNPNQQDHLGRSPIIMASSSGLSLVIDRLLKIPGIHINFVDPSGWNALFHAKAKGHLDIVEKLVASGADIELKAKNRLRFEDIEVENQREDIGKDISVDEAFCDKPILSKFHNDLANETGLKQVENFLSLLPDSGGGGGLNDIADSLLQSVWFDSEQLLIRPSLPDVLSGNEVLLETLGVAFTFDRHRIMQAAHRFHILKWDCTSLIRIPSKQPMGLSEIGNVLCNYLQQLVIMNASVQYLNQRIDCYYQDHELANSTDIVELMAGLHETNVSLERQLKAVLTSLKKIQPIQQSMGDYKGPELKTKLNEASIPFKITAALLAFFGAIWIKFYRQPTVSLGMSK